MNTDGTTPETGEQTLPAGVSSSRPRRSKSTASSKISCPVCAASFCTAETSEQEINNHILSCFNKEEMRAISNLMSPAKLSRFSTAKTPIASKRKSSVGKTKSNKAKSAVSVRKQQKSLADKNPHGMVPMCTPDETEIVKSKPKVSNVPVRERKLQKKPADKNREGGGAPKFCTPDDIEIETASLSPNIIICPVCSWRFHLFEISETEVHGHINACLLENDQNDLWENFDDSSSTAGDDYDGNARSKDKGLGLDSYCLSTNNNVSSAPPPNAVGEKKTKKRVSAKRKPPVFNGDSKLIQYAKEREIRRDAFWKRLGHDTELQKVIQDFFE